jgi:hypothetical protein
MAVDANRAICTEPDSRRFASRTTRHFDNGGDLNTPIFLVFAIKFIATSDCCMRVVAIIHSKTGRFERCFNAF